MKWADGKALPVLLCLLLIVEVPPHLWAFKAAESNSSGTHIYGPTGTYDFTGKKYFTGCFFAGQMLFSLLLELKTKPHFVFPSG